MLRYLTKLASALLTAAFALAPMPAAHAQSQGMMLATLNPTPVIQQDVARLHTLGADMVRFPVYFSYEPSVTVWLDKADAVLATCESRNVTCVVDFHHPTPGHFNSDIVDVNDFVAKWQAFAQRFQSRTRIWYDLCNEPNHPQWRSVALQAAQAIRAIDPVHKIVFAPRGTTTAPATTFNPLAGITNQVLEFHFYNWTDVQFHPYSPAGDTQVTAYPSPGRTGADLDALLNAVRDAGLRTGLPVLIGEVAISREHPNAGRFLRDFAAKCRARNIKLILHAYREADIWNYELNPNAWTQITNWLAL
ncbi:MAG: cellulase family glycosylhydrolase [Planctomycetes bacterium]|nr:cellulase family glycosylhydrolase [Planctomycetota bacterium]